MTTPEPIDRNDPPVERITDTPSATTPTAPPWFVAIAGALERLGVQLRTAANEPTRRTQSPAVVAYLQKLRDEHADRQAAASIKAAIEAEVERVAARTGTPLDLLGLRPTAGRNDLASPIPHTHGVKAAWLPWHYAAATHDWRSRCRVDGCLAYQTAPTPEVAAKVPGAEFCTPLVIINGAPYYDHDLDGRSTLDASGAIPVPGVGTYAPSGSGGTLHAGGPVGLAGGAGRRFDTATRRAAERLVEFGRSQQIDLQLAEDGRLTATPPDAPTMVDQVNKLIGETLASPGPQRAPTGRPVDSAVAASLSWYGANAPDPVAEAQTYYGDKAAGVTDGPAFDPQPVSGRITGVYANGAAVEIAGGPVEVKAGDVIRVSTSMVNGRMVAHVEASPPPAPEPRKLKAKAALRAQVAELEATRDQLAQQLDTARARNGRLNEKLAKASRTRDHYRDQLERHAPGVLDGSSGVTAGPRITTGR